MGAPDPARPLRQCARGLTGACGAKTQTPSGEERNGAQAPVGSRRAKHMCGRPQPFSAKAGNGRAGSNATFAHGSWRAGLSSTPTAVRENWRVVRRALTALLIASATGESTTSAPGGAPTPTQHCGGGCSRSGVSRLPRRSRASPEEAGPPGLPGVGRRGRVGSTGPAPETPRSKASIDSKPASLSRCFRVANSSRKSGWSSTRAGVNHPASTHSTPSTTGSASAGARARKNRVSKRTGRLIGVIQRENSTRSCRSMFAIEVSSASSRSAAARRRSSPPPSPGSAAPRKRPDAAHHLRTRAPSDHQHFDRRRVTQQDHRRRVARFSRRHAARLSPPHTGLPRRPREDRVTTC